MRKPIGVTSPYRRVSSVTWHNAALRLGEELKSVGPDGYYDMTPEQWLEWALLATKDWKNEEIRSLQAKTQSRESGTTDAPAPVQRS